MINKNSSTLFFVTVILLSTSSFLIWKYIEKNNPQLPYFGSGKMVNNFSYAQKININPVPAFSFINEEGKTIDQNFVKNKIWIADFFFTSCGTICPKMSNQLQRVQQEFSSNNEVKIISFTCDPERDNPKQLNTYATNYNANKKQWKFATGDKQSLYRFARKGLNISATDGDGGLNDFIHSQNFVLIDKEGYIRGYYDGTDEQSVNQLIIDIKNFYKK